MTINNSIIEYITNSLGVIPNETSEEINSIIENLSEECYIFEDTKTSYNLNGIEYNILELNYSYLIPNIFRSCYVLNKLYIPNICIEYINNPTYLNFFPIILDENTIKSLLYYNAPINVRYFNNLTRNITNILNLKRYVINNSKRNSTYGSYTLTQTIFNDIYGQGSLLTELLSLNNYINNSINIATNNLSINDYTVLWDFTRGCINNSNDINNTYITGNFNYNYKITSLDSKYMYKIKDYIQRYSNSNIINNNIFTILKYAQDVTQDIMLKIKYYLTDGIYCDQDYMDIKNIPNLVNLYKNFYNNQNETISKALPNVSVYDVNPIIININTYLVDYNKIYIKTYPLRYLLKNILLDNDSAITIYTNVSDWTIAQSTINYYYYYINISSPSAIELTNINNNFTTSNYLYTDVNIFMTEFNEEYSNSIESSVNILNNTYNNEGLYPQGGTALENVDGYLYNFIDIYGNTNLVFETLQSYSPYDPSSENNGKGVALVIYNN